VPRLNRPGQAGWNEDSQSQGNPNASDTPKSTHGPSGFTDSTGLVPRTLGILPNSTPETSGVLTSLWADSLARRSALLGTSLDLETPEGLSSLISLGFLPTKDPDISYSKTYEVYLVTTLEKLSSRYLGFLPTWGTMWNGMWLTAKTMGSPKAGNGPSLSVIVEDDPDSRSFLPPDRVARIRQSASQQKPQLLVH
jgi:hypothetical protein